MSNTITKDKRRTTLTLEADVNSEIQRRLRENPRLKEKTLVNELLRRGLDATKKEKALPEDFSVKPFKTNRVEGITDARIEEMLKEI